MEVVSLPEPGNHGGMQRPPRQKMSDGLGPLSLTEPQPVSIPATDKKRGGAGNMMRARENFTEDFGG